jgi:predicted small secreted protein
MTQEVVTSLTGIIPVVVAAGVVLTVAEKVLKDKVLKEDKPLPASKKVSKRRADYVAKSKVSGQMCHNCEFFQSGSNTCEIVKGKISPNGWSKFWEKD